MSTWFFGDIHGQADKLVRLLEKVVPLVKAEDRLVFLGDYIDRGPEAFRVVETLVRLSTELGCTFLLGNHEDMMAGVFDGRYSMDQWLRNGGGATLASYEAAGFSLIAEGNGKETLGNRLPQGHGSVLCSARYVVEGSDFVAVHAGLRPSCKDQPALSSRRDVLWIREDFYMSGTVWPRTVVFGHTPTAVLGADPGKVWHDPERRLLGIDTGAAWGGPLSCVRWPEGRVFRSAGGEYALHQK